MMKSVSYGLLLLVYISKIQMQYIVSVYLITWECEKEFNLQGISFPMALKDIPKFEKANNVLISVYGYQERK